MPESPQRNPRRRSRSVIRSSDGEHDRRTRNSSEDRQYKRSRREDVIPDRSRRRKSHERHRKYDETDRYRDSRRRQTSRDRSHSPRRSPHRRRSPSPEPRRRRRSRDASRSPDPRRSNKPLPSQTDSFTDQLATTNNLPNPLPTKQKPNYKPTGLLAKEANTVSGTSTVLKYHEPPEARKPSPKHQWRLYIFKNKDLLTTIHLYERSVWLIGRDKKITDLHVEHPSVSKQHAVIQFRYITSVNEYGEKSGRVKPYVIDLESANGTKLNGEKLAASRYVELVDGDILLFGDSEREYVVMLPAI